ncbi:MAG: prolyl oligopeptidase family serine peptidase, partial [Treponema sp.]|nr:prolyl oligopeptidase family serine peptidase [Treponema sp.]
ITQVSKNRFTCSFDGINHDFIIDLPENSQKAPQKNTPLVILLPGAGNTAEAFRTTIHFEEKANQRGYAVVYVTGARNKNEPTGPIGWNSGITNDGNDDVGFLVELTKYLQEEYSFDKKRTYAAGFSNGGFMIHRLAMEAGHTFAACVSVAGKMTEKIWEQKNKRNTVGMFQISGEKDKTVPKKSDNSASFSKDPAIEDVMTYWAQSNNLKLSNTTEIGAASTLTKWCGKRKNQKQVWHLFVKDGHHAWPTEKINRIDANSLILDFFEANTN